MDTMTSADERELLYRLLGDLPERDRAVAAETVSVVEREGYVLETLRLDLNGEEDVPAYFARPAEGALPPEGGGSAEGTRSVTGRARAPVILYSHAHGDDYELGKRELVAGRDALQRPPYAVALTALGCSALAIDHWNFGGRQGIDLPPRTESELFKEMLWKGKVLFGHMVYDNLKALDYLVSRADVDPARIGALGMSMGSTLSWWTAALDDRISAVADICCMTDFHSLIARRGLDGHGIYYYVPGLLKHFSTAAIQKLICPRPHLSLAGDLDPLTPPEGLAAIDREVSEEYRSRGAPSAWRLERYSVGHVETAAMRREVLSFFSRCFGLRECRREHPPRPSAEL